MFIRLMGNAAPIFLIASVAGCNGGGGTTTAPILTLPPPLVISSTTLAADFSTWVDNLLVNDKSAFIKLFNVALMAQIATANVSSLRRSL